MDDRRFDEIAQRVAEGVSRRGTFRALAGAVAGAVATRFGGEAAAQEAAGRKKPKNCRNAGKPCGGGNGACCDGLTCSDGRCRCPGNQKRCKGECIPANDCCRNRDCEVRGAQCRPNGTCACPAEKKQVCGDKCTNVDTDAKNCGECGRACASAEVCSNGFTCQAADCLPVTETDGEVVRASNGGLTFSSSYDPANPAGATSGAAVLAVPAGTTFAEISSAVLEFAYSEGTCGAGSPRFTFRFTEEAASIVAAIPPALCSAEDASGTTGNLIENTTDDFTVWSAIGDNDVSSYQEALAKYGESEIKDILVNSDSSNGVTQVVTLKPCVKIQS